MIFSTVSSILRIRSWSTSCAKADAENCSWVMIFIRFSQLLLFQNVFQAFDEMANFFRFGGKTRFVDDESCADFINVGDDRQPIFADCVSRLDDIQNVIGKSDDRRQDRKS